MRETLLIITLLFFLQSCDTSKQVKYVDGRQVPILDSTSDKIKIIAPNQVLAGDEYLAVVTIDSKTEKFLMSYAQCDFENSLVDTSEKKLHNCSTKLYTRNDTTLFAVTPTEAGTDLHFKIALLTVGTDNLFYLHVRHLKFKTISKPYP